MSPDTQITPTEVASIQPSSSDWLNKHKHSVGTGITAIGLSALATFSPVEVQAFGQPEEPPAGNPTATVPEQTQIEQEQQQTTPPAFPIVQGFPEPTQQVVKLPEHGILRVDTDGLNFREKPIDGKPIATLPQGAVLEILPDDPKTLTPTGWKRARTPSGQTGYVATSFGENTFSTVITSTQGIDASIQAQFTFTETVTLPKPTKAISLTDAFKATGGAVDDYERGLVYSMGLKTNKQRQGGEATEVSPLQETGQSFIAYQRAIAIAAAETHEQNQALTQNSPTQQYEGWRLINIQTSPNSQLATYTRIQENGSIDVITRAGNTTYTIARFGADEDGQIQIQHSGFMDEKVFYTYVGDHDQAVALARSMTDIGGDDPTTLLKEVAEWDRTGVFVPSDEDGYFVPPLKRTDLLKVKHTDPYGDVVYTLENGQLFADVYDLNGEQVKEFQTTQNTETGEWGWEEVVEEEVAEEGDIFKEFGLIIAEKKGLVLETTTPTIALTNRFRDALDAQGISSETLSLENLREDRFDELDAALSYRIQQIAAINGSPAAKQLAKLNPEQFRGQLSSLPTGSISLMVGSIHDGSTTYRVEEIPIEGILRASYVFDTGVTNTAIPRQLYAAADESGAGISLIRGAGGEYSFVVQIPDKSLLYNTQAVLDYLKVADPQGEVAGLLGVEPEDSEAIAEALLKVNANQTMTTGLFQGLAYYTVPNADQQGSVALGADLSIKNFPRYVSTGSIYQNMAPVGLTNAAEANVGKTPAQILRSQIETSLFE